MWPFGKKNQPQGEKAVFTINGLHCTSCVLTIDGELEDTPGVLSSKTSYAQSRTEVEFEPEKVSVAALKKTIEKLGYTVE